MWKYLQNVSPEIEFLLLRRFTQDCLEHFFSDIRGLNGNAFNPTSIQFSNSFKKLFSIKYCTVKTGNCERDNTEIFAAITNFREKNNMDVESKTDDIKQILLDDHDYRKMDVNEQDVFRYTCGYLIRKCIKKHSCEICLQYARSYIDLNQTSYYCFFKAYNSTKNNPFGSLFMPNDDFVMYIKTLEDLFYSKIEELIIQKHVVFKLINTFKDVPFSHPCQHFSYDYLLKLYACVRLFYTLKFINRSFKSQPGYRKAIILRHN